MCVRMLTSLVCVVREFVHAFVVRLASIQMLL